jgi:NAD(P)-dependent dehydrogenase (short-subunit alcohol dehydrogenase family)
MGQVEGKVAIVTGGASGIGAACAITLAREGAKLVATDLADASGQALVARIPETGGEAVFCARTSASRRLGPVSSTLPNSALDASM